jgi:hypothetical protein
MGVEDRITTKRTDEEYFEILRDRIIECICREIKSTKEVIFHGVDMVRRCAGGYLDEGGANQYEFSGEHEYYQHVLQRIYKPLLDMRLIVEYENNNYGIPENSRLREICRREFSGKSYIKWDDFLRTARE